MSTQCTPYCSNSKVQEVHSIFNTVKLTFLPCRSKDSFVKTSQLLRKSIKILKKKWYNNTLDIGLSIVVQFTKTMSDHSGSKDKTIKSVKQKPLWFFRRAIHCYTLVLSSSPVHNKSEKPELRVSQVPIHFFVKNKSGNFTRYGPRSAVPADRLLSTKGLKWFFSEHCSKIFDSNLKTSS